MNIKKIQNVHFTGKVNFVSPTDVKNALLKPLITQLEPNCGGDEIEHSIKMTEESIRVTSKRMPEGDIKGLAGLLAGRVIKRRGFLRKYIIFNAPTEEHIKTLIEWSKGTDSWINATKKMKTTKIK